jgi:hypothetical protein
MQDSAAGSSRSQTTTAALLHREMPPYGRYQSWGNVTGLHRNRVGHRVRQTPREALLARRFHWCLRSTIRSGVSTLAGRLRRRRDFSRGLSSRQDLARSLRRRRNLARRLSRRQDLARGLGRGRNLARGLSSGQDLGRSLRGRRYFARCLGRRIRLTRSLSRR